MSGMWSDDILGWRGRVGLILPATNLLLETALPRMAPEGVTFHTARLKTTSSASPDALKEMSKQIIDAARDLAAAEVDLIAYCCTASSFIQGRAHDEEVIGEIAEKTKLPTVTTMGSIVDALKQLGVRRLITVSPYVTELEELESKYLEREGFSIAASAAMGISDMIGLHDPSPGDIYRLARKTWVDKGDGVLISCNALRAHVVADALEKSLRCPVVTSLTATLWGLLRAIGVNDSISGYGRLLEFPLMPGRNAS
jgi:maleate isomerase